MNATFSRGHRHAGTRLAAGLWLLCTLAGCKEEKLPAGECQSAHMYAADDLCYVCLTTGEDEQFSLVRNIGIYNEPDSDRPFCASYIRFWQDVDTIPLADPLILQGASGLVLEPNPDDATVRRVTLDASAASELPEAERVLVDGESVSCALVVRADGLQLRRLQVTGYRYGPGICVLGDEVTLEDCAAVDNAGDGVVFADRARLNTIRGLFEARDNGGYGVRIADEAGTGNIVEAVPGLTLTGNALGAARSTAEPMQIRVDAPTPSLDPQGQAREHEWVISGQLLRCNPDDPPELCSERGGQAIQLHRAAPPDAAADLSEDRTTFLRYLDRSEFQDTGAFAFTVNDQNDGSEFFLIAEAEQGEPAATSDRIHVGP